MKRRQYQFLAIAILLGAPLLVSLLSSMLMPVDLPAAEMENSVAESAPVLAEPMAEMPEMQSDALPPVAQPAQHFVGEGGATLSTEPSLDTTGLSVGGADPLNPAIAAGMDPIPMTPVGSMPGVAVAVDETPISGQTPQFREGPASAR